MRIYQLYILSGLTENVDILKTYFVLAMYNDANGAYSFPWLPIVWYNL